MTLIQSLLIFYPLIIPVWESGPFDSKNIARAESLDFINTPGVQYQIKTFQQIKDPRLRGRMAIDLINSNNPEAIKGLTFVYELEKIDSVKANILTVLYKLKHITKSNNTALLKACLDNDNVIIRGYGSALYLDKTKDTATVLELLKSEKSLFVKNLLWNDLRPYFKECPVNLLEDLSKSEDALNRAGAVRLLAKTLDDPDSNATLQKAVSDKEAIVRVYLAEGVASRTSGGLVLLQELLKDKMSQVRAFVASAKSTPSRIKIHIALSSDVDPEIRRLAIVALRHYKEPVAIDTLLNSMNDSYKPTRTAAEYSLIFMKPSSAILERIGKEYLKQKPAVYSAVRVLGVLNDQRFNAKIEEILNSATDTDLMRRAVNALGALNYKKAAASIAKKASSKDPLVREAVGNALGVFNIKSTFDILIKLSSDKKLNASLAAVKGMGVTKDPYFINRLLKVAANVQSSPNMRAFSYWSLAQINQPSPAMIKRLQRNVLRKIIPVPMAGPDFDADFARIAASLALMELSKKDAAAKSSALRILKNLTTPSSEQTMQQRSSETLQEYARQAELYMQGKKIQSVPLPTANPVMTVKKYVKK